MIKDGTFTFSSTRFLLPIMRNWEPFLLRFLMLVSVIIFNITPGFSAPTTSTPAFNSTTQLHAQPALHISKNEMTKALAAHLMDVEEFRFIRNEAQNLGVRVYLFGGTAASYAHYTKWDVLRLKGDARYQPQRFDYDYTNIYRSTQDLDIVVDGPAEKALALQDRLRAQFPYLQGNKSAWEVRLLRESMGGAEALLNNSDFLNQHTDSNSVGLIEVTVPPADEPLVRDLRDWNSSSPFFLKDVLEGKIHFYFSPLHNSTTRYLDGTNPPLFSVIRYLTKAFQYDVAMREEDLAIVRSVIKDFNPKTELTKHYTQERLESLGKKLIQHAVNIESAWNQLETLGLRQLLIGIKNNTYESQSMAWWLNREPLRSKPIGVFDSNHHSQNSSDQTPSNKPWLGMTAGEIAKVLNLNELIVSHETIDFLAYESITRAHTGEPNVLVSRQGAYTGETAMYGEGFYVRMGRAGARGTGFTIRFSVHPQAREGVDFVLSGAEDHFIFRNKAALKVIPESLNIGPIEYFEMLASNQSLNSTDRGILEKLRRRINHKGHSLSSEEIQQIYSLVLGEIKKLETPSTPPPRLNENLLFEWFHLDISDQYWSDLYTLIRHPSNLNLALKILEILQTKNIDKFHLWLSQNRVKLLSTTIQSMLDGGISNVDPSYFFLVTDYFALQTTTSEKFDVPPKLLEQWQWLRLYLKYSAGYLPLDRLLAELEKTPELKKNNQWFQLFFTRLMQDLFNSRHLTDYELKLVREFILSAPAGKDLSDWQALAFLSAFSNEYSPGLAPDIFINSPLWVAQSWSKKERDEVLGILGSPFNSFQMWKLIYFLAEQQSKQMKLKGSEILYSPGQAWQSFTNTVYGHLPENRLPLSPPENLLGVLDASRWDQTSIDELFLVLTRELESHRRSKNAKNRSPLLSLLTLPITSYNQRLRQLVVKSLRGTDLLPHLELSYPHWVGQRETIATHYQKLKAHPESLSGLSIVQHLLITKPTRSSHKLLKAVLRISGTTVKVEQIHRNQARTALSSLDVYLIVNEGLLFTPAYRDLLSDFLNMLKRHGATIMTDTLELLEAYVVKHKSILNRDRQAWQDLLNHQSEPKIIQQMTQIFAPLNLSNPSLFLNSADVATLSCQKSLTPK